MAGRSKSAGKAVRLPNGTYAYRGRAVSFSAIPKREQARFRHVWASKAAKTRAQESRRIAEKETAKDRRSAREWLQRRSEKVEAQLEHTPSLRDAYPAPLTAAEIAGKLTPAQVAGLRKLQRKAHAAYMRNKKRAGGKAAEIADTITEMLGPELARAMPQVWWYH